MDTNRRYTSVWPSHGFLRSKGVNQISSRMLYPLRPSRISLKLNFCWCLGLHWRIFFCYFAVSRCRRVFCTLQQPDLLLILHLELPSASTSTLPLTVHQAQSLCFNTSNNGQQTLVEDFEIQRNVFLKQILVYQTIKPTSNFFLGLFQLSN